MVVIISVYFWWGDSAKVCNTYEWLNKSTKDKSMRDLPNFIWQSNAQTIDFMSLDKPHCFSILVLGNVLLLIMATRPWSYQETA